MSKTPAVAIIGVAGVFPRARTVADLWRAIVRGEDCTADVPPTHWRLEDHYDPDPARPDHTHARRGGFIEPFDFDPVAFGLPPHTLASIDTAQLLALQVAREALDDAGYGARPFRRDRTGVILGVAGTTMKLVGAMAARMNGPLLRRILASAGVPDDRADAVLTRYALAHPEWTEDVFPGFLANVVAGRICSRLDLGGPSFALDAACASALGAVSAALAELALGRCDMVITGGVDADNSITAYMSFSKTHAVTAGQHVRPFDAEADGTLLAEAVGMLVLKRLDDARADGDHVYAIIRGLGSASDGRSKSIYAPRQDGQRRALELAYADAGVAPASVGLVEAHGTGTAVGDATEVRARAEVYADATPGSVALGSVKSQLGHAKAAAGAVSLIKAALSLDQKVLPPTLHVQTPNPALAGSPFYLPRAARPWLGGPRRAAVSAFGFGGANYHVVLEEADPTGGRRLGPGPRPALLSAPDPEALLTRCAAARAALTGPEAWATAAGLWAAPLPDPAHPRLGLLGATPAEFVAALDRFLARGAARAWDGPGLSYRPRAVGGRVAALFSGQGSQRLDMGLPLALTEPAVRAAFEAMDAAMPPRPPISDVVYPRDDLPRAAQEARLRETLHAQAGIGALSAGLWRLLQRAGVPVSAAAGHSFGELVALWAAGVLDEPTFFRLVAARGRALTAPPGVDGGGMAALRCDLAAATALLAEHPALTLANHNGPTQVVIGGPTPALERLLASRADGEFVRLDVAAAFHTPSVAWAEAPWRAALAQAAFAPPAFPVYADGAAQPYPVDPDAAREALARQPFEPVRFDPLLRRMYDDGVRLFVEVGPGTALTGMVARALGDDALAVPLLADSQPDALDQALLRLLVAGVPVRPQHEAPPPPRPRSAATVQLAGPHLVPPSRRAALEGALSSPLSPLVPAASNVERPGAPPPAAPPVERPSAPDLVQDLELATLAAHERYLQVELSHTALLTELAARGDDALLLRLQAHQEALLSTHRAFLEGQRTQAERLSGGPPRPTAWPAQPTRPEAPPRSVAPPPSVHAAPEPARPKPAPVAPEAPRPATSPVEQVRDALYAVLSEQTGYPAEVFLPGMDLEADLGVDSIKRVAILGAAGRKLGLAEVPRGLRDARSLGEVLDALAAATGTAPAPPAGPSAHDLLLEIVAERTGYPAEVLLPEMDLEADLGIDSIKRVALLAEVGKRLELNEAVDRARLRELRTLGEVLGLFTSLAPSAPLRLDTGAAPRSAAAPYPGTRVPPLPAPPPNNGALPRSPAPPRADNDATLPTRRLLRLEPLPAPRPLPRVLPDRHHVLVVSDDAEALVALVAALAARELPLVAVWAGDDEAPELPEWVDWVTLPGRDEVALQRTLDWVHHNLGPTAALLLAPTAAAHDRRWLGLALLLVRFLQPALQACAGAVVLGVRLDGALGRRGSPRALAAGLLGLTRTLRHELPEVSSRLVDLGPGAPVELLVPELLDADPGEALVGYDGGQRAGLRFADAPREGAAVELRPDRVVLVTGGARGITAACAVALAQATGGRYLLIGRTPLPAEPAWATGVEGPALRGAAARALAADGRPSPRAIEELARTISQAREVRDTLAALAACGAEARYVELDLSAPDVAALDAALSGWGPVHTLLHGAGALADGPLSTRSLATLDRVFGPKVDGLDALLRWLDPAPPARVVLFSSVAASHGNAGQADYAMANAVLDQTAAALAARWPGTQATSLAWGPWDGGMVTPELRERFLARGVGVIPRDAGAAACVWEVLHPGAPHVILGEAPLPPEPAPRAVTLRSALSVSRLPLLDDHRIGGGAVLPAAWAMGWMVDAAAALWPGHTEVHDLRVLRGVRFTDDEERALLLDLRPEDGHVSARLRSFVDGREQLHYAATLHPPTSRAAPPPPVAAAVTADPAAWREACVLRYGPAFPTPARLLTLDERGAALGFDACPAPARWYEPGSDVNPWAYELATHAALVWLWERHRTACLPLVTGRFTPLRPLPAGAPFVVSVQIDSFTPDEVCFGFAVYDLAGEALAVGAELRMTPVPPDSPLWGR